MAAGDLFILHFQAHNLALESASSITQWQISLRDERHLYI